MPRRPGEEKILDVGGTRWRFEINMHPAQLEIFEHPARFKAIAAGRRFGKTTLCGASCLIRAVATPDANVMWVAPAHRQARMAMRMIAKMIPTQHREINRTTQEIFLSSGGRMAFVSGERPDNLRGEGLDLVVIDEAAFVTEGLWTQAIRPALSDRDGKALLISTFDGENWFYDLYRDALDPDTEQWQGWIFTTGDNPYIPPGEIEEAKRKLPKEVFLQEYMAVPTAFSGAVFDGDSLVRAAKAGQDAAAVPTGQKTEAGLDWGWNFTALEVCADVDGKLVWIDEEVYERIELERRCEEIARKCIEHNIEVIYSDAATPTANVTLAKVLARSVAHTEVQPVPFNAYKRAGIMTRNWHLENDLEAITPACRRLLMDSKSYHYTEDGEKPVKSNDHTVDAATAFYASRAYVLGDEQLGEAV